MKIEKKGENPPKYDKMTHKRIIFVFSSFIKKIWNEKINAGF